eukprot:g4296.t1
MKSILSVDDFVKQWKKTVREKWLMRSKELFKSNNFELASVRWYLSEKYSKETLTKREKIRIDEDKVVIEKDMHRFNFLDEVNMEDEYFRGVCQSAGLTLPTFIKRVENVLFAYLHANIDPGYCQGMHWIAGTIVACFPKEDEIDEAYVTFSALIRFCLPKNWFSRPPASMNGVNAETLLSVAFCEPLNLSMSGKEVLSYFYDSNQYFITNNTSNTTTDNGNSDAGTDNASNTDTDNGENTDTDKENNTGNDNTLEEQQLLLLSNCIFAVQILGPQVYPALGLEVYPLPVVGIILDELFSGNRDALVLSLLAALKYHMPNLNASMESSEIYSILHKGFSKIEKECYSKCITEAKSVIPKITFATERKRIQDDLAKQWTDKHHLRTLLRSLRRRDTEEENFDDQENYDSSSSSSKEEEGLKVTQENTSTPESHHELQWSIETLKEIEKSFSRICEENREAGGKSARVNGLTKDQVIEVFKNLAVKMPMQPRAFVDRIFTLYDEDTTGYLDFRELVCLLSSVIDASLQRRLRFCFELFDCNGSGDLDDIECLKLAQTLRKSVAQDNDDQAKAKRKEMDDALFFRLKAMDGNSDGRITFHEFSHFLMHSGDPALLAALGFGISGKDETSTVAKGQVVEALDKIGRKTQCILQ